MRAGGGQERGEKEREVIGWKVRGKKRAKDLSKGFQYINMKEGEGERERERRELKWFGQ